MNGPGDAKNAALAPARDPLVGAVINGKYHVHRAIARGGMGRIYYATQAPLERPVALKVVVTDGHDPVEAQNFLGRFLQEASILAKLQHPNVVTLFDYGKIESGAPVAGDMYFIAMELLAGETLSLRLKQRNVLTAPEVLFLIRQIARGLREAHSRGVVHRDLKPSNIILVPEGDGGELVKIVDFGIGKVVAVEDVTKDLTQEGMMLGTPRYMAPEQFEGTASPASDIYALGTIAYQALAGSLPFSGTTLSEFMVAKFAHGIPPIRQLYPEANLPSSLEALVRAMLTREPAERPSLESLFNHLALCEHEVFGHAQSGPTSLHPSGTGSHPRLSEPSRVPPTVVQPIPPIPLGGGTLGMTPRPTSSSMGPPRSASVGARRWVVVALVVGIVGLGLGSTGVYAVKRARSQNASAGSASASGAASAPNLATAPDSAFTCMIDSSPTGASVFEGETKLGETPLTFSIARASVANGPRTFVLKKDGYLSVNVVQGSTDDRQTKQMVTLALDATKASGTKATTHGKPALDIRRNR